jgi:catechol 2,3-dioxygenase-like lactoylglutathione lyase family enzyme
MPTLDTLKKQAKQILRWRREGNYEVAQRIRHALPRCRAMSDAEILAADFTLGHAQEVVAREQGFESWAALKAGLQPMTTTTAKAAVTPQLAFCEPTLFVSDVRASCAWFEQVLGFARQFLYGEPPFYGQVARDGQRLNLRYVCDPVFVGDIRELEDLRSADIGVRGLKPLFEEFKAAGADFHSPIRKHPWGVSDFVVRDPDGNLIAFNNTPEIEKPAT